ncbi:MAG: right-handed parallel beta-helix repeat-containing protein, partial [Pirellulales bacterium]|nr:right-handed parallel beta-helix repeat-containing protein [Pirellulales bacterium]
MLAVISVAPQPGDDPAALFADAIESANATAEPDIIELAQSTYDLSTLDASTLKIDSEISIVGVSPSQTAIVPAPGVLAIEVTEKGSLDLSKLTLYASAGSHAGALHVEGSARLNDVAVIGLTDISFLREFNLHFSTLVRGDGNIEINNSALIDSAGLGLQINGGGSAKIENTIISGSSAQAIYALASSFVLSESTIFDNGRGAFLVGLDGDLHVSGSTITDNQNTLNLSLFAFDGSPHKQAGLSVIKFGDEGSVSIDDDNVIIGNQTDPALPEIQTNGADAPSF